MDAFGPSVIGIKAQSRRVANFGVSESAIVVDTPLVQAPQTRPIGFSATYHVTHVCRFTGYFLSHEQ